MIRYLILLFSICILFPSLLGAHRDNLFKDIKFDRISIEQGLSQKDLARKAGVTQQMVSRIENAANANMTQSTVSKIAGALGKDVGLVSR